MDGRASRARSRASKEKNDQEVGWPRSLFRYVRYRIRWRGRPRQQGRALASFTLDGYSLAFDRLNFQAGTDGHELHACITCYQYSEMNEKAGLSELAGAMLRGLIKTTSKSPSMRPRFFWIVC